MFPGVFLGVFPGVLPVVSTAWQTPCSCWAGATPHLHITPPPSLRYSSGGREGGPGTSLRVHQHTNIQISFDMSVVDCARNCMKDDCVPNFYIMALLAGYNLPTSQQYQPNIDTRLQYNQTSPTNSSLQLARFQFSL